MVFMKQIESLIANKNTGKISSNWINIKSLRNHFNSCTLPNASLEEWKNFSTNNIKKKDWSFSAKNISKVEDNFRNKYDNSIVIKNGEYSEELSNYSSIKGLKVYSLDDYAKKYPDKLKNIYNNPDKYSEKRLSGVIDKRTTALMSLNALLKKGVVISIDKNTPIDKTITIYNYSLGNMALINPYVYIIAEKNSSACFAEISNYNKENWINLFYEIYLEESAKINFSTVPLNCISCITTSSINFHLKKNAYLNLALLNKENMKNDIRIFLKEENAKADINGILLSSLDKESDVYCKVVHLKKNTKSNQNWRLISADKSKTSVNGKIRVNKDSSKSDAKFSSKSLLLNEKASSHSKPELEIFEGDISCSHGATFGEIDKDKLFYLQSRGVDKKLATKILLLSFINEIKLPGEVIKETIINEIKTFLESKL